MSVSVEQYNSLVERISRLEALAQTPATANLTTQRIQPVEAEAEDEDNEAPITGALNLRVVPMSRTEKALTNCVYFNTGNEVDSGAQYLAHTRNMYIMKAVYDSTLPPGTLETGMFTRLNAELPMNCKRNFFKMGVEGAEPCRSLTVEMTRVGRPDDGAPPCVEDVHRCLYGQLINDTRTRNTQTFVVTKGVGSEAVYKATVREATPGMVTAATDIVVPTS